MVEKQIPWENVGRWRCPSCRSIKLTKDGIIKGKQRYRCSRCDFHTLRPMGANIKRQDPAKVYKTRWKERLEQRKKEKGKRK